MRHVRAIFAFALCAAGPVTPAHAISNSAAILLTLPANARSIAMGDIGTADNSDPSTIFYNPANVCSATRVYGLVSQQRFELDDNIWLRRANVGFSGSSPQSPWMVGLDFGYARLRYGQLAVVDTGGNPVDSVDTYEDVAAVTMGLGFHAGPSFDMRFGGAVKVWRARFDQQYQATSFDAGVAVTLHERYGAWNITPSLGGALIDAGEDIQYPNQSSDPLPTRLNAGASLCIESSPCNVMSARVPLLAVTVQAEAINPLHDEVEWGIGDEIAIAQILFVRNGVRRYATSDSSMNAPTYASWGVGAGIPAGGLRMRFDYARQANPADKDHMDVLVEWKF
jgi:hypothetical protein